MYGQVRGAAVAAMVVTAPLSESSVLLLPVHLPSLMPTLPRHHLLGREPACAPVMPLLLPSGYLLSAVGCSEHPAGVNQGTPTEVALGHGGGQRQ